MTAKIVSFDSEPCFQGWHLGNTMVTLENHLQKKTTLSMFNLLFFLRVIKCLHCYVQQPNDEDPLNHEAAVVLRDNPKMFEANVKRAMAGGYVGQNYFPRCA